MVSTRASSTGGAPPPPSSLKPGYIPAHIAVLVKDNYASKLAVKLAKSLIQNPARDRLTLIHMVSSELASYSAEEKVLSQFNQDPYFKECISYKVGVQEEGMKLTELVSEAVTVLKPHLLVIGSQGLCNDILNDMEAARRANAARARGGNGGVSIPQGATMAALAPLGSQTRRKPSRMSTAMRLAQALHQQVPLLFVKATSAGVYSSGKAQGLRCMMDLTSTARHGLEWLLGRLNPARGDAMVLAVGRAIDCNEQIRQHAVRLLTTFGVQASVSQLGGARKKPMREASQVALPGAVEQEKIDVLMIQAPRCKDLSVATTDVIINARTAVLIWPPDRLANGTVVKPPHPLREMLDESIPEEERPLLRPQDQPENLVSEGPWRGRGSARYSFRERDNGQWDPAMFPIGAMVLRRSLSDALMGEGYNRYGRMERALSRALTTAVTRQRPFQHAHSGGGNEDIFEDDDHHLSVGGSVVGGVGRRASGDVSVGGMPPNDDTEFDASGDQDRQTWPPRAGVAPWQRPSNAALAAAAAARMAAPPSTGVLSTTNSLSAPMAPIAEETPQRLSPRTSVGKRANLGKRASAHAELPTLAPPPPPPGPPRPGPRANANGIAFGRSLPPGTLPMLPAHNKDGSTSVGAGSNTAKGNMNSSGAGGSRKSVWAAAASAAVAAVAAEGAAAAGGSTGGATITPQGSLKRRVSVTPPHASSGLRLPAGQPLVHAAA